MSLHKIYNFVGYNNLGLILEQERKHWLMKPDKKLQVQDSASGSIFQGRIENNGDEITKLVGNSLDDFLFNLDDFRRILKYVINWMPNEYDLDSTVYIVNTGEKISDGDSSIIVDSKTIMIDSESDEIGLKDFGKRFYKYIPEAKDDEGTWDTTAMANIVDYKEDFELLKEVLDNE